jgi:Flp pilus assembly protein TadD
MVLLTDLQRFKEAETAFRRAIELDPRDGSPWNGLGNVLQRHSRRYEEAELAYRRAIELDPAEAHPWNGLGALLADHLKRPQEAERAYWRAIELEAQLVYPWSNLGRLLDDDLDRSLEAAQAYLQALQIDPARSADLASLVRVCERLGKSAKDLPTAINLLQQARELAPDDRGTQSTLAQLLTLAGRWAEAIALLEQLAAGEAYSTGIFKALVKTGHVGEALAVFERTGANQRCRPLYEALQAVKAGTSDYLRRVAPEVRTVAL